MAPMPARPEGVSVQAITSIRQQTGRNSRLERRAHERIPATITAEVVALNGPVQATARCVVEDISLSGMRLRTEQARTSGDRLLVTFAFPGDVHRMTVEAAIVACDHGDAGSFVTHCRFVKLPPSVLLRIVNWAIARADEKAA
jgi:hypothetical protein